MRFSKVLQGNATSINNAYVPARVLVNYQAERGLESEPWRTVSVTGALNFPTGVSPSVNLGDSVSVQFQTVAHMAAVRLQLFRVEGGTVTQVVSDWQVPPTQLIDERSPSYHFTAPDLFQMVRGTWVSYPVPTFAQISGTASFSGNLTQGVLFTPPVGRESHKYEIQFVPSADLNTGLIPVVQASNQMAGSFQMVVSFGSLQNAFTGTVEWTVSYPVLHNQDRIFIAGF